MDKKNSKAAAKPTAPSREDRLKKALKANLQRRKQQAKARNEQDKHGD
ncbi:MAG: hypothetical protein OIF40_15485 [Mangrovicoccus sp.]|nr:hypothetical protein [Mangrovicoccus sp.]